MNIFPINFNPSSDSGPNSFTNGLFRYLKDFHSISIESNIQNSDVEFCLIQSHFKRIKPRLTRLDGIYFNISQDFNSLNDPIKNTYNDSSCVIFQSEFNKSLIERWFGEHENGVVIRNRANIDKISKIDKLSLKDTFPDQEIWSCASSWRPHKRLRENIRYFIENSASDSILIVAGKGAKPEDFSGYEDLINKRIFYAGHLDWESLIGLYKSSSYFIHLAYLDHCPNVVVDAAACNCNIICSSTGGTSEIDAFNKTIIQEKEWDFSPVMLYEPPKIDFKNFKKETTDKINYLPYSGVKYFNELEKIIEIP